MAMPYPGHPTHSMKIAMISSLLGSCGLKYDQLCGKESSAVVSAMLTLHHCLNQSLENMNYM